MITLAGLRALLARNEHEAALGAVERIRYRMLESQLAKARADAEEARRRLFDYQLDEREEIARLRLENRRLDAENAALQKAAWVMSKYEPAEKPVQAVSEPVRCLGAPVPQTPAHSRRKPFKPLLSAAALSILKRDPPDPAGFDRTITEEDAKHAR